MDSNLENVINKIRRNDVTLWAGAGLSLYAGFPTGQQIAEEIVNSMPKHQQENFRNRTLPDVAEEFVQMRGNSKVEVFRILNNFFDKEPTSITYHEKLAEIPQIKQIVTTNYDDLFERAYGKSRISVILKNSHIAISNTPVKLYKVHGDMSDPESIVLTTSDYNNFFTFSHNNKSLWNKVTSLADESSFLFLGYSLEDPNTDKLIREMIDRVGQFRHESFLVVPNLADYKVQNLHAKGITYINMTGEEFIDKVHKEVISNIVKDFDAGFLSVEEVDKVLKKKDINANYEFREGKASLSGFGTSKEEDPLSLRMDIRKEEHSSFVEFLNNDIENQEFEIDGDAISNIIAELKGVNFPPFDSSTETLKLKIIKYPDKIMEGDLFIRETNDILEDINIQVFKIPNAIKVKLIHEVFEINTVVKGLSDPSSQNFTVSFNRTGNLTKDYRASIFLRNWLVNGKTAVFNNHTEGKTVELEGPKELTTESEQSREMREKINFFADFCKKIFEIQQFFGVYFDVPQQINKKDEQALDKAMMVISKEKRKTPGIDITIGAKSNQRLINDFLENEVLPFKEVLGEPSKVNIFNQEINLGYIFVETLDAYLENKEEVLKQLGEGSDKIRLIIKSKSDEMFFGYQEKKEIY